MTILTTNPQLREIITEDIFDIVLTDDDQWEETLSRLHRSGKKVYALDHEHQAHGHA